MAMFDRSRQLVSAAARRIPGGVNSNYRLQRGVRALERGAWFLSAAHTDALIDETVAAVAATAKTLAYDKVAQ